MRVAELNKDQVHAVAAHLAVTEAIIETRLPVEVEPEERRYRLVVDGHLVQVISRRTGDWQVSDATCPLLADTAAVILVDFIPDVPEFYVVPADQLNQGVKQRHEKFMARVGTRPRNPDSKHHRVVTDDVAEWRGRWDVLRRRAA